MDPSEMNFGDARRRRIYEYVERKGTAKPETVRQNVLVHAESASKPARSGAAYDPEVMMPPAEFKHHVSILKRDGYLAERDGKLTVAFHPDEHATEVDADGLTAVVRPARQQDITGIVGVIRSVAGEGDHLVAKRLARDLERTDVLLRHNESETRTFFVATVEEDAVGWLHVAAPGLPEMRHTAELTIGVLEDYRGTGIGSALMEMGLEWAAEQGYRKVYQGTQAGNERGIAFLEANGWEREAVRKGQYLVGGELVDEVQLARWLDE
jgi:GNAT superfamily N-acetyltransferase